jgi:outer membrane protein
MNVWHRSSKLENPEIAKVESDSRRSALNLMKLTLMRLLTAAAVVVSAAAFAQNTGTAPAPGSALPVAPSAASDPAPALGANATGVKIGAISIEQAIFGSNEGQRDLNALGTKFEPKSKELKGLSDEIEALKNQQKTQGDKLNDDAKANLQRQIDQKQKSLDRQAQDAREDFQNQQNEIGQRILQKMAPIIVKYASDNGYGMIIDTSGNNQWPQGPVLWHGPAIDITAPVVSAYNTQSGVPAPAAPANKPASGLGTKPSTGAGAGTTSRPAAPAATKPTTTTPPK